MDAFVPRRSIVDRMRGAAMFDVPTYEEVERDASATGQAAVVVALAAVAAAIGNAFRGGNGILGGLVASLLGWVLWSGITYVIGTRVFKGTATWGELARTLGFAQAPGILMVLAIIPVLGVLVKFVVWIWMLGTGIVAIRQALDIDTGKAVMTAVVGWLAMVVVSWVLMGLFGVAMR
ncbi:MAG: Yip1 family protein [Gemmatirosa sp.]